MTRNYPNLISALLLVLGSRLGLEDLTGGVIEQDFFAICRLFEDNPLQFFLACVKTGQISGECREFSTTRDFFTA